MTEQFVRQKLSSDQTNDIIVAYNLLLDSNPQLRISVSAGNLQALHSVESSEALDAIKSFATSPPMNLRDEDSLIPTPKSVASLATSLGSSSFSQVAVGGSSFTQHMEMDDDEEYDLGASRSLGSKPLKMASAGNMVVSNKSNWYLGVLTEKSPDAVMTECYRVLRLCEFEWKTVTKFNIRVRPMAGTRRRAMSMSKKRRSVFGTRERTPDGREEKSSSHDNVKFELAVYRVNALQCLVDMKRLSDEGTTTGFIMTCNLLTSLLSL